MNINVSFHPYYFPAQKIRKVSHYSTLDKAGGGRNRDTAQTETVRVSDVPVNLSGSLKQSE